MVWYEDEVKRVEEERGKLNYEPAVIFYGSSSIRLWESLYEDFEMFHPVNLGFGGSTLAACDWFFNRIMQQYQPRHMVFYAGDNDLGDGRNPEEVYIFFKQLLVAVNNRFPNISLSFISIKPSIARWNIIAQIRYTNQLISEVIAAGEGKHFYVDIFAPMLNNTGKPDPKYFDADGLHLSKQGYALWKDIVLEHLNKIL